MKYDVIYEKIVNRFFKDIYGNYYNRVTKEDFVIYLAQQGWKYFTVKDLNTLFYIKLGTYKAKVVKGEVDNEIKSTKDDLDDDSDVRSCQFDIIPKKIKKSQRS